MKEELSKEKEKNQEKEEEILKASNENEELQKTILKVTAENEANERVIQKLLDKITNSSTNNQKTIEESTPTASVSSRNAPLVIDCLICSSQIKSGQEVKPVFKPHRTSTEAKNMSLIADPPACTVPAAGGASTHKLVNGGAEKLIFKIKSSNNIEYRITPVFGFIDPSGSKYIQITRTAGAPKEDKRVIYFANAPADATNAQAAFASVIPAGTVTIPISATA